MLCVSMQNACGKCEKEPRLSGGLQTAGSAWSHHGRLVLGSWHACSDHGQILASENFVRILEFFVAGAVFGVGGWLLLLRAMQMTLMCCDYQT